jgi:ATP-dependent exoDNAse (exonuclease V) beta subunit
MPKRIEEERRLSYVALTRAGERCIFPGRPGVRK